MTKKQFNEITAWQDKTFPGGTCFSKLIHLKEEIEEVAKELIVDGEGIHNEFADCFILLFGAASSAGMSYADICKAIDDKMKINKARKWAKPDKNGVVKHIK